MGLISLFFVCVCVCFSLFTCFFAFFRLGELWAAWLCVDWHLALIYHLFRLFLLPFFFLLTRCYPMLDWYYLLELVRSFSILVLFCSQLRFSLDNVCCYVLEVHFFSLLYLTELYAHWMNSSSLMIIISHLAFFIIILMISVQSKSPAVHICHPNFPLVTWKFWSDSSKKGPSLNLLALIPYSTVDDTVLLFSCLGLFDCILDIMHKPPPQKKL